MAEVNRVSSRFPQFPWDTLAEAKQRAQQHHRGLVDLSIGTPVDPAPQLAQNALRVASDAHGYPTVAGGDSVRAAAGSWLDRRFGIDGIQPTQVLPTIGSKEFIANLCVQLGIGPSDDVVVPELAYPTYEVSAAYSGATTVRTDSVTELGSNSPRLIFLNSPANPHGHVSSAENLRHWVQFARERDAVLVSDECYLEFVWEGEPVSVLHRSVNDGSLDNLLAVHSLSKRSNMAGYRDGFVIGDNSLISELLAVRKHLGFMLPTPVSAAMQAALSDDAHVDQQRKRYAERRRQLKAALESAGFEISHSQGSLYLWATRGEPCRATIAWLAERGILAAPGDFYGPRGNAHIRIAFTATDERINAAVQRLAT